MAKASWTVPMMMKENGYEYTMWLEEVDVKSNAVECIIEQDVLPFVVVAIIVII